MELQFKHQPFQADAAKAVVDVFQGQPKRDFRHSIDPGVGDQKNLNFTGWRNAPIELRQETILENIRRVQRAHQIRPSERLEGRYNLTIEMETGVGKTYTYIKTMHELHKHYGWCKFIIVVPSVAIREGVLKSFEITKKHFSAKYETQIRAFIYNSARLDMLNSFASDKSISAIIINAQAFNAKGKDARRIYMRLDSFRSRRPIDVIAQTNPILIIDEPQSVEGKQTKTRLQDFNPLLTLRYSATHKSDSVYNMIYRLDAMEAYNQRLVKKIAVKGVSEAGNMATEGYVYLESVNLSHADPTATLQIDYKGASSVRKVTKTVTIGTNLYDLSNRLEEYKNNFVVKFIDGRDNHIEFLNGVKLFAGEVIGKVHEESLRRIQIRETILTHLERERQLFARGIKVLSLFFIDEVAKYKQYNSAGEAQNGVYADIFEEEYADILAHQQREFGDDEYMRYLNAIAAQSTHAGYFSVDKKGKMIDSKVGRKETTSDDIEAYDLIMKNKELLLERDPKKSPVRFIFSHSALREGWDNPNVFQICTLKQSSSDMRKRQEVGRGLRLCVNQWGERQDANVLEGDIHHVNVLTIIASESYEQFTKGLQTELAEAVAHRPVAVTAALFKGQTIVDTQGRKEIIDENKAMAIHEELIKNKYIERGQLTDKYFSDKSKGAIQLSEDLMPCIDSIIKIIDTVYDARALRPENARNQNVTISLDRQKLAMAEFKSLWEKISPKSAYAVKFDEEELTQKCIDALNSHLRVRPIFFKIESGAMTKIESKEALDAGTAFVKSNNEEQRAPIYAKSGVKYDLIGKLVEATGLTRQAIVQIMTGIQEQTFNQFKNNPEEFILKATEIINTEKATVIIQHITYHALEERHKTEEIFTEPRLRGVLNLNTFKVNRHLYDHVVVDSDIERDFAKEVDIDTNVAIYVKLPKKFYISTPVGRYNPDWAIAFHKGDIKHIYFVAETKGTMNTMQLRPIEHSKIICAKEHFKAIAAEDVVFHHVTSWDDLKSLIGMR